WSSLRQRSSPGTTRRDEEEPGMIRPAYPFTAIVGQEQMKMALLLAAIDWRLGVLLRGDKGSGKTTAARGLAELLPEPSPFINLPIGRLMKGDGSGSSSANPRAAVVLPLPLSPRSKTPSRQSIAA